MKKILWEINLLMGVYWRYRLIITNDKIELKLTPKLNSQDEINWIVDNDKEGRLNLFYSLKNLLNE